MILNWFWTSLWPSAAAVPRHPEGQDQVPFVEPPGPSVETCLLSGPQCVSQIPWVWRVFGGLDAIATNYISPNLFTATKLFYIISGQHQFSAACSVAEQKKKELLPVPRCFFFNCSGWNGKLLVK